jgi:hypothetical protein
MATGRCPPRTLSRTAFALAAAFAVTLQLVTACTSNTERLRGRTPDQVKQACDPQQRTGEECARELDR